MCVCVCVCVCVSDWSTRVKQIAKLWRKASSQDRAPFVVSFSSAQQEVTERRNVFRLERNCKLNHVLLPVEETTDLFVKQFSVISLCNHIAGSGSACEPFKIRFAFPWESHRSVSVYRSSFPVLLGSVLAQVLILTFHEHIWTGPILRPQSCIDL